MNVIHIIGAIIFGGYFAYNGIMHFVNIEGLSGYASAKKVPMAKFAVAFTGIMLLVGGLSIMTGFLDEIGVWVLLAFMVVTTAMMHQFWKEKDAARMNDQIQFAKNLAIIGALLMLA